MKTNDISLIVDLMEVKLKEYYCDFNRNNIRYLEKYNESSTFLYEPTLASFCSRVMFDHLSSIGNYFFATEFNVNVSLNSGEQQVIKYEVANEKGKNNWKKMYFDAYVYDGNKDIYIEYKLKKKFNYYHLANDFLKFKIATNSNHNNSLFLYFSLTMNGKSASIKKYNKITQLNRLIDKEVVEDSDVFYYENNYSKRIFTYDLVKESDLLETIIDREEKIEKILMKHNINKMEDELFDKMHRFKKNVITSEYIKRNYSYIHNIYEVILEKNQNKISGVNIDSVSPIEIIEKDEYYFSNFIDNAFRERKLSSYQSGLANYVRVSLAFISLLQWYCSEEFPDLNICPIYFKKTIGKRAYQQVISDQDIAKTNIAEFKLIYDNITFKIKQMIERTIFYIITVYPLLFEIKDNKVIGEKDGFTLRKLNNELKAAVNQLCKILKIKNNQAEIDKLILKKIIGKFEKDD